MATYYLFLDEIKANNQYKHFCLGGCIIEDLTYKKEIIPYINGLKQRIFGNSTIILHENQISQKKDDGYTILKNESLNKDFWDGMKYLFDNFKFNTVCVGVDCSKFCKVYKKKSDITNSEYYIALQIILENYVHFLESNNSKGSVYIESRGLESDIQLQEQYDLIKKQGTLFIQKEIFQNRLKTISFPMKIDNNIGIQIADFIPNPIARNYDDIAQKQFSLFDSICKKAYDGNNSLSERFGIKKVL